MEFELETIHNAALEIARMGGIHTLQYFGKQIEVERKEDDSPVTQADRETEDIMRKEIGRRFPSHGIVGEEYGSTNKDSSVQWVLDPIDGTKSFIHGVPLYTTLLGVLVENQPVIGIIFAPALDEMCEAAKGKGTRLNGNACSVRSCSSIANATFLSTDVTTPPETGFNKAFQGLLRECRIHRTWGDAYGHMLVATGRADLMFDPVLNIWDAAPLLTVMQESGGIFCDVRGKQTIHSGNGISCSKELQPEILTFFT